MKPIYSSVLRTALSFALLTGAAKAQTEPAGLPVPAALKPDMVPPIPAALAESIGPYLESRTATFLGWNPSAREVLILTRFGNVPQLHRVAGPGAARRQITFFPDRVGAGAWNPANADEILFTKDKGGDEFYQLYLLNNKDGKSKLLTDGGRSRNSMGLWSPDGRRICFTSTKRSGRDGDVVVLDPHEPSSARILVQGENETWGAEDWSPDGTKLLVSLFRSAVVSELYLVDVASGEKEKLGPDKPEVGYFDAKFTADGKSAWVVSTAEGDSRSLIRLDLAAHKAVRARPATRWDVEGISVSSNSKWLAWVENEDGASKLHVMDADTQKDAVLPQIPNGVITTLDWRHGSDDLGFTLSAAKTPGDVYSVTPGSNRLERWTMSETGGLDASQFVDPELIHWKSFDGMGISGFLYKPPSRFTGPRPVIINIHGGPEGQSRPQYTGSRNYLVNELGVAVIYPNVRGSTGYGTAFLNADNGVKREDSVKDIGALLDWIATQPGLDASRIMVTGGSYGGYMTLATMTHYNDRVRCAIEQVGISNFRTFLERTEPYRRDLRRVEYGDERDPTMRDFFETIAPLNNAAKITKPMFIAAGRNDPRVAWQEGRQMADALRANHDEAWFLVAEDEGHGYAKKANQDYYFAASVEFMRRFLLN